MYFVAIGALLLVLKMADVTPVGGWPWWGVLLPFGLAVVWWAIADATGYTRRRAMAADEAKREARRRQQLEALGAAPKRRR